MRTTVDQRNLHLKRHGMVHRLPLQVIEPVQEGFRVGAVVCQHAVVHVHCYGRYIASRAHLAPLAGAVENLVQNARQHLCRLGAQLVVAARRLRRPLQRCGEHARVSDDFRLRYQAWRARTLLHAHTKVDSKDAGAWECIVQELYVSVTLARGYEEDCLQSMHDRDVCGRCQVEC
jgi:hypothetical protein